MEINVSEHLGVKSPTEKSPESMVFSPQENAHMHTNLRAISEDLCDQKAYLGHPDYELLFQSNRIPGTIWALPYVAKKSLLTPYTKG